MWGQGRGPRRRRGIGEEAICPYLGLRPFQEKHARYFFGREALTQWLLEDVRVGNFLAIIGPSGSGKSSLARAGLVAALKRGEIEGSRERLICEQRSSTNPQHLTRLGNLARVPGARRRVAVRIFTSAGECQQLGKVVSLWRRA